MFHVRRRSGTEALLAWYLDDSFKAAIGLVNNNLLAQVSAQGTQQLFPQPPPLWWQLRTDAINLSFEVSLDGMEWQVLNTAPVPSFFTTVEPTLAGGTKQAVATPGRARFDFLLDCVGP